MIFKLEKNIQRCDLIIVAGLGYIPLDRIGAEHFFGFFSRCYKQTSPVVTTNLPFADWPPGRWINGMHTSFTVRLSCRTASLTIV